MRFLKVTGLPGVLVAHPHAPSPAQGQPRRFVGQQLKVTPPAKEDIDGLADHYEPVTELVQHTHSLAHDIRVGNLTLDAEIDARTHGHALEKLAPKAPPKPTKTASEPAKES